MLLAFFPTSLYVSLLSTVSVDVYHFLSMAFSKLIVMSTLMDMVLRQLKNESAKTMDDSILFASNTMQRPVLCALFCSPGLRSVITKFNGFAGK